MSYYIKQEMVQEFLKERLSEYDISTMDKKDTGSIYITKTNMFIGNSNGIWSKVVESPNELTDWFIDKNFRRYPYVLKMIDEAANYDK